MPVCIDRYKKLIDIKKYFSTFFLVYVQINLNFNSYTANLLTSFHIIKLKNQHVF